MSDDLDQIRPKSVPLSHTQTNSARPGQRPSLSNLVWILAAGVGIMLLLAVFLVVPELVKPDPDAPVTVVAPAGNPTDPQPSTPAQVPLNDDSPAPFAAVQREQARAQAQEKLAEFVELQMQLEETMQVGAWGQAQLDEAKSLATQGDEQFLDERYPEALQAYDAAAVELAALIDTGAGLLADSLANGQTALDQADQQLAEEQFNLALTIDPENAPALAGLKRAQLLPEVVILMRQAKNHELAGAWQPAVDVYLQVEALDPATQGLQPALSAARAGKKAEQIRGHLSDGFAAMDAKRFTEARQAFQAALRLDPGNGVARGGLEQVSRGTDVARIAQLRESATAAEATENWQQAITDYEQVLSLDANIQFAKDGRQRANEQYRTQAALANIIANPDKLSSPQLFDQAKDILARAQRLAPRGTQLGEQISQVSELIRVYATPVLVTLSSDSATKVTLSTVGVLGKFDSKQLTLRPGAYTLIGSRNGYRDVRTSMLVRPDMQPLDIRCTETF
jgi:tetratricopeptide (TPR) repeat protein